MGLDLFPAKGDDKVWGFILLFFYFCALRLQSGVNSDSCLKRDWVTRYVSKIF